jgi:hypothetical protein
MQAMQQQGHAAAAAAGGGSGGGSGGGGGGGGGLFGGILLGPHGGGGGGGGGGMHHGMSSSSQSAGGRTDNAAALQRVYAASRIREGGIGRRDRDSELEKAVQRLSSASLPLPCFSPLFPRFPAPHHLPISLDTGADIETGGLVDNIRESDSGRPAGLRA